MSRNSFTINAGKSALFGTSFMNMTMKSVLSREMYHNLTDSVRQIQTKWLRCRWSVYFYVSIDGIFDSHIANNSKLFGLAQSESRLFVFLSYVLRNNWKTIRKWKKTKIKLYLCWVAAIHWWVLALKNWIPTGKRFVWRTHSLRFCFECARWRWVRSIQVVSCFISNGLLI